MLILNPIKKQCVYFFQIIQGGLMLISYQNTFLNPNIFIIHIPHNSYNTQENEDVTIQGLLRDVCEVLVKYN